MVLDAEYACNELDRMFQLTYNETKNCYVNKSVDR
jgi:hypothetical protein